MFKVMFQGDPSAAPILFQSCASYDEANLLIEIEQAFLGDPVQNGNYFYLEVQE